MGHKFHRIESVLSVNDGLEHSEMGELLESAIKFFLFQRMQIPVPFNSLHQASSADDDDDSDISGLQKIQNGELQDEDQDDDENHQENPIDRQRRLVSRKIPDSDSTELIM